MVIKIDGSFGGSRKIKASNLDDLDFSLLSQSVETLITPGSTNNIVDQDKNC